MVMAADPTKVMGRRVVATLIDGALVTVPAAILLTSELTYLESNQLHGVSPSAYCQQYTDDQGGICLHANDRVYFGDFGDGPALLLFGLTILIHIVLQGLTGWTPGKLITGIRMVRADGRPAGLVKALTRWVFWLVDGMPLFILQGLVGFIVGLTTVGHRRVGDMVAKTFVVRKHAAGHEILVAGLTAPPGAGGLPLAPPPTAKHGPQWDDARGTYIQWDPDQSAWMEWSEAGGAWGPISVAPPPSELPDPTPPPPPPPPPAI